MKKLTLFFVSLSFVAMTSMAWAIPATWTDLDTFNQKINSGQSFNYSHSVLPAFTPLEDLITGYNLLIGIHDDSRYDSFEIALIDQPGATGDRFYDFSYANNTIGLSLAGLIQLNALGTLDIRVTSLLGDFYFDSSKLTASGYDNTAVPEPGTMILLGAGLLGLAVYGKRRMNKE